MTTTIPPPAAAADPPPLLLPWTTARCNRLLRPLSSRLAILRKEFPELRRERLYAHTSHAHAHGGGGGAGSNTGSSGSRRRSISAKDNLPATARRTTVVVKAARGGGGGGGGAAAEKLRDPDWMPVPGPRSYSRRQYSAAGAGRKPSFAQGGGQPPGTPGRIDFSTPFIVRSMAHVMDTPVGGIAAPRELLCGGREKRKSAAAEAKTMLEDLRGEMTEHLFKQVGGLCEGFGNLLDATKEGDVAPARRDHQQGPRSLLAVCLRQVPAYIALEEYWRDVDDEEEDDRRDVQDEIYSLLEQLGAAPGQGWRSLREVVRAHGVFLLKEAIEDGILNGDLVRKLVDVCLKQAAWDEAEVLLSAYASKQKLLPPPKRFGSPLYKPETSSCASLLHDFTHATHRWGFFFRQLTSLLLSGQLPMEWLGTQQLDGAYMNAARLLLDEQHRHHADALKFVEVSFLILCGVPADGMPRGVLRREKDLAGPDVLDALDTRFHNLVGMLVGTTIGQLRQQTGSSELARLPPTVRLIYSMAIAIASKQRSLKPPAPSSSRSSSSCRARASAVLMALLVLHRCSADVLTPAVPVDTDRLITAIDRIHDLWDASDGSSTQKQTQKQKQKKQKTDGIQRLLHDLPRYSRGVIANEEPFAIVQHLARAFLPRPEETRRLSGLGQWVLRRLALETALSYAVRTNRPEHHGFARFVEQQATRVHVLLPPRREAVEGGTTPVKGNGFRWEETICEWVKCTPSVGVAKAGKPARSLLLTPALSAQDEEVVERKTMAHVLIPLKNLKRNCRDFEEYDEEEQEQDGARRSKRQRTITSFSSFYHDSEDESMDEEASSSSSHGAVQLTTPPTHHPSRARTRSSLKDITNTSQLSRRSLPTHFKPPATTTNSAPRTLRPRRPPASTAPRDRNLRPRRRSTRPRLPAVYAADAGGCGSSGEDDEEEEGLRGEAAGRGMPTRCRRRNASRMGVLTPSTSTTTTATTGAESDVDTPDDEEEEQARTTSRNLLWRQGRASHPSSSSSSGRRAAPSIRDSISDSDSESDSEDGDSESEEEKEEDGEEDEDDELHTIAVGGKIPRRHRRDLLVRRQQRSARNAREGREVRLAQRRRRVSVPDRGGDADADGHGQSEDELSFV